jgi:tRNA G18 (ribose-2'-O)-methylase SpoU
VTEHPHKADTIGVGPWPGGPGAWPDDPRYDPELLRDGDRRNVVDRYRYWTVEAIVADIDTRRHPLHVAIENFSHDMNIGSVVRTANAFAVAEVHIVGRRRWNRRGAMVTDRYQHLRHHAHVSDLLAWAEERRLPILGIDNVPGSEPIEGRALPREALMVFGSESGGLSAEARAACEVILHISQHGSTRSINAGAAAAVAMHSWMLQHARPTDHDETPL